MNQILQNKITASSNKRKNKSKQKIFRLQFFSSIILFIIIVEIYLLNLQARNKEENTTKQIANNYNITRLYNNNSFESETYNQNGHFFTVIGMIEIPKISIYYPIISESNDELLKISPCRISGPMPNEDGNLCIAGHNYDNYKFFSKLSSLKIDDEITGSIADGKISNKSTIVGFYKQGTKFIAGDSDAINGIEIDWDKTNKIVTVKFVYIENAYRLNGDEI